MPGETEPIVFETEQALAIEKLPDQALPDETPKGTVWAGQYITYLGEVLGSGNGTECQTVCTRRAPVLSGQRLEVREPDLPTTTERETIEKEEKNAVRAVADSTGHAKEIWVRWHEVPDFYASGPRDRHYVIDRLNGVIHFGDGVNGLIPPLGSGNLVMTEYRVGGGAAGNRPAGTITQLRTAVAGIGNVTNADPARGGADTESTERLLDRAPRALRHGGRAVTREDFEDLAIEASPDVARAKCLPLFDLSPGAGGEPWTKNKPGVLSVIIVPRSSDPAPMLNDELLRRVRDYLAERSISTAEFTVCGPIYVRVSVRSEVVIAPRETPQKVRDRIEEALRGFLHPLTGGVDAVGWEFGREPYRSDLYALLEEVPGVDYVRRLSDPELDVPTLIPSEIGFTTRLNGETYLRAVREAKPGFFLVCSGDHDVTCLRASEVSELHG